MPTYDVDVGGKTYEVDAPDPNTAWRWANQTHEAGVQRSAETTAADQQAQRERFAEEEKNRPLLERIRTNVGAGIHKLGQAVTFAGKEDVEEHKRLRQQAAETMPGGEWVQMAGEIVPTLLAPAGAVGQGLRMLPRVGAAIGRGISTRAGNIANIAGTGGVLGAWTTPGDLGDRVIGGALSAAGGAVLPASVAAVQGGRRMVTQRGGQLATGERFLRELAQEAPGRPQQLVSALEQQGPTRQTLAGVERPTAAQLTGDPVLRELEVGARTRQGASFQAGDEAAAQGRANVLNRIAGTPEDLAAAEGRRLAATAPLREGALDAASQWHGQGFERPVMQAAVEIAQGGSRSNPAVQTMVNYVIRELEQGVTPEQLYTIRKTLTTGVPRGSELGAAITQARSERMHLVSAIDDALNAATGGQWGQYLQRFQQLSQPVTSMRAGQQIQRDFAGSANQTLQGDPILTASKLRNAILARGEKQFGGRTVSRITPAERARLNAIADSAEMQARAQQSQGLIGSRTAGNISAGDNVRALAAGVGELVGGGLPGTMLSAGLTRGAKERNERILASVLQDPELLAEVIRRAQAAQRVTRAVGEVGGRGGRAITDILED